MDDKLNVLYEEAVEFDSALPEFRTQKGVIQMKDGKTVYSPSIMWVKALDIILDKLQVLGADFGRVAAISGTAQVKYSPTNRYRIFRRETERKFVFSNH